MCRICKKPIQIGQGYLYNSVYANGEKALCHNLCCLSRPLLAESCCRMEGDTDDSALPFGSPCVWAKSTEAKARGMKVHPGLLDGDMEFWKKIYKESGVIEKLSYLISFIRLTINRQSEILEVQDPSSDASKFWKKAWVKVKDLLVISIPVIGAVLKLPAATIAALIEAMKDLMKDN